MVGFCGSRSLPACWASFVARVCASLCPAGGPAAVGCAAGADSFVRAALPGAVVFRVASFGSGRWAFAARSAALVRAVAASPSPLFVAFVSAPCPAGVVPSRSFRGLGSGSWGAVALAVGLGVPVRVFWCGSVPAPAFPAWLQENSQGSLF